SVTKFDTNGNNLGLWAQFPAGFLGAPESIVFDRAGNAYVGSAGSPDIYEFDSAGNQINVFTVQRGGRTDWIQLASDQRTLVYTSDGDHVYRYDTVTKTQLPDLASGLPFPITYAIRFLEVPCGQATGDVLVANSGSILRLNSAGTIVQQYVIPNEFVLFSIN